MRGGGGEAYGSRRSAGGTEGFNDGHESDVSYDNGDDSICCRHVWSGESRLDVRISDIRSAKGSYATRTRDGRRIKGTRTDATNSARTRIN